jgi:hypothetical protein
MAVEERVQLGATVELRRYPILSGAFLAALAVALIVASWAVGTEYYPYIHRPVGYRFSLAALDRVYLAALLVLALHYAAYVVHFLIVGSRQTAQTTVPALVFSPAKFVITWFFLVGLLGAYALGASIATPALFDAALGPARETAFVRVWNHTYFGFVLLAAVAAGITYFIWNGRRRQGALRWVADLLSLAPGHRFIGALNLILLLAVASNIATGLFILGAAPLVPSPRLPVHAYWMENAARLAHDIGTAFIVASFSGQIYFRLIPGNQWMLKTMFAGYEART